jgi:hypothetical protein
MAEDLEHRFQDAQDFFFLLLFFSLRFFAFFAVRRSRTQISQIFTDGRKVWTRISGCTGFLCSSALCASLRSLRLKDLEHRFHRYSQMAEDPGHGFQDAQDFSALLLFALLCVLCG